MKLIATLPPRALLGCLLLLSGLWVRPVHATHTMGADITYTCVGNNAYQVTLTLFRDCGGITPLSSQLLTYRSVSCGVSANLTLTQVGGPVDVTPLCPTQTSACSGGSSQFGIEQYLFTGLLTLPSGCSDWELGWSNCCRNFAITTLNNPGNQATYVPASLNNALTPCNNSPIFTNIPTPLVCVNQPVVYNHGVTDPDGDELRFSLTNCMQDEAIPISYGLGFSALAPLSTVSGVTIDSLTGAISFTPDQVQIGVICVLVEEYRNGVKIGETVRDMQFSVLNCTNAPPVASGVNGDSVDFSVDFCVGGELCFDILISDPDGDQVTATWNSGIPGSNLTFSGNGSAAPTARFCWSPTAADTGLNFFTLTVTDDHCPIVGAATYAFTINVSPSAGVLNASPDQSLCPGESVSLLASATPVADSIRWAPASGLSDPTIANPIAAPQTSTTYLATAYLPSGCVVQEPVLVSVLPPPPLTLAPPVAQICAGGSVVLRAQAPTASSYQWSTGATSDTLLVSPGIATPYAVTVTDANGCTNDATLTVAVVTPSADLCNVVYVTPGGTGDGSPDQPTNLLDALDLATCTPLVVKMNEGTYPLDAPIQFLPDNVTLEGGFQASNNWRKVSTPGLTTIHRSALNPEGPANALRLSAFDLTGATGFRLQDLTLTTEHATLPGMSTYGLHLTNCSDYDIVRCRILPGDAADGEDGQPGADGANGAPGQAGQDGADDTQALAGAGGDGGAGGGLNGGAGGAGGADPPGCCMTGNNGSNGSSASDNRSGGGGGGGASGGEEDHFGGFGGRGGGINGASPNGGIGGAGGADGGACFGSNVTGLPGSPGFNGSNGTDGADATLGPNGTHTNGYWVPGTQAASGSDGNGGLGGGGGGGGGGEQCTCCFDGAGSGGGGGGGGGQGGTGGIGGTGGGSSYAVYLYNNGTGGNISSCFFTPGTSGEGGMGGNGGLGGEGGLGGPGSDYGSASGNGVGPGGDGGQGGDGGNGGRGGDGTSGQARAVFQSGGTLLALTSADTAFNLVAQPVIDMDNVSCVNTNCTFSTSSVSTWDMGLLADPPSPLTGASVTVSYSATGRQDVLVNGQLFEDFVFIQSAANPLPEAATSAPLVDGYYRLCRGSDASFTATNGSSGFEYRWDLDSAAATWVFDSSIYQTLNSFTFSQSDTFFVQLQYRTDCCGLSVADTLPIIVEEAPELLVAGPSALCAGQGPVTLSASGGAHYQWTPATGLSSDTSAMVQASPTSTTTYQLTATNASGLCRDQSSYTLTVNDLLLNGSTNDAGCQATGAATVLVSNGSGFYSYQWSNGGNNATIFNVPAGSYRVRVTDALTGCADSATMLVAQNPNTLSAYVAGTTPTSCAGSSDGSASVGISGASGLVGYSWSNGANTPNIGPVAAGTYTVLVTDGAGCEVALPVTVPAAPPIVPALQAQTVPDCDTYGTALVSASGGNGPYQFVWNTTPPQAGPNADSLVAGSYQVTVIDQASCSTSMAVNVPGPASPVVLQVSTVQDASTCSANDGSATVLATGSGSIAYTWETTPVQTGPTLSNVSRGSYVVYATGPDGCADTLGLEIGPNCPLPQGLLSFEVAAGPGYLDLHWEVADFFRQAAPYVIERSLDGADFAEVGKVAQPQARIGERARFDWRDAGVPPAQWVYYRLRQTNAEGLMAYSAVKRGRIGSSAQWQVLRHFPVPARAALHVELSSPGPTPLRFDLINPQGQLVKQKTLVLPEGITTLIVQMESFASGVYVLQLHSPIYGTRRLSFVKE